MRAAIRESELTRYQIWKRSGVSQSVLCRFVNGRSGLSLDAVNRLAEVLGLESWRIAWSAIWAAAEFP